MTAWNPLRHPVFRAIWIATLVSNIGTWMQNTAAAWLMTSLTTSPVMIALVQTATTLPLFLLALPAGALADIFDRRRLILLTQTWMLSAAAALGILTIMGRTTPWLLLALTLILAIGAALNGPAWQAIVPELVPREDLPAAVALNSAGFNLARSVGPALGGFAVVLTGAGIAFFLNAASFLGVIVVLSFWKSSRSSTTTLPAEHIPDAIRTGLRYARHAPLLSTILVRAAAFSVFGIALVALLPVLARQQLHLDSLGYGALLGIFGVGAVIGAALLPRLRARLSPDRLVCLAILLFAAVYLVLAYVPYLPAVCVALTLGGAAWLCIIGTLNAAVQTAVPSWVRGRALAVYMFTFFGGMAFGSALWGIVTSFFGLSTAFSLAALGLAAGIVLTLPFRLPETENLDLTPSMHWGNPRPPVEPHHDRGPVLVMIEYRIAPHNAPDFIRAMRDLRTLRLRDGATRWDLFSDAAEPHRYVESFMVPSWIEHLRQHERVTVADRTLETRAHSFHEGPEPPRVTHLLAERLPTI